VILLDTSVLIEVMTGRLEEAGTLRRALAQGERIAISALALYEWLRGPRTPAEVAAQQEILPVERALAFGPREALVAARLYKDAARARRREVDLAIAATAIVHDAELWTLDAGGFADIPGLRLYSPSG
jgi:predicted nucleic acid-binding protein